MRMVRVKLSESLSAVAAVSAYGIMYAFHWLSGLINMDGPFEEI